MTADVTKGKGDGALQGVHGWACPSQSHSSTTFFQKQSGHLCTLTNWKLVWLKDAVIDFI